MWNKTMMLHIACGEENKGEREREREREKWMKIEKERKKRKRKENIFYVVWMWRAK